MKQREKASDRRAVRSSVVTKRTADARALALLPTVRKLKAKGFVSHRAMADELNRTDISAPLGGRWHLTAVVRLLTRLGLILGERRINNDWHTSWPQMRGQCL
jgi:hypothetical protein